MTTILAVVPAYNEAAHITAVVGGVLRQLPVLVVDDGSTDQTGLLAQHAGATVIRQRSNQGKGAALRAGFRHAIEQQVDAVLTLDADGQHDPSEAHKFARSFTARHADLIVGTRTFTKMPLVRREAYSLGERAFSWAIGQPVRDNQSGYRLVSRRLMEATLASTETGFEFEVEMIFAAHAKGLEVDWVPIKTIYSDEESHISPLKHLANFFRIIRKMARKY